MTQTLVSAVRASKTYFMVLAIALVAVCAVSGTAKAQSLPGGTCTGQFVNPISDVCWECIAPITLGSIPVYPSSKKDFGNPDLPLCFCGSPIPRIGLAIGFWEPARLADVSREKWCFVNLGGMKVDPGIGFSDKAAEAREDGLELDNWHVHWYIYPLMYWLELLTDFLCLEASAFDIAYLTELDPLWQDDALNLIISPEAGLFANIPAQLACAADCTLSSAAMGRPEMFWCMGCNGSTYPVTGNIGHQNSEAQGAVLAAERMAFKLHRQLIAWGTSGSQSLCQKTPMPVMDKRQYRWQMTNPKAITKGPFTCPTTGATTMTYEFNTVKPIVAKDLGYLIWRKRNCCAL